VITDKTGTGEFAIRPATAAVPTTSTTAVAGGDQLAGRLVTTTVVTATSATGTAVSAGTTDVSGQLH